MRRLIWALMVAGTVLSSCSPYSDQSAGEVSNWSGLQDSRWIDLTYAFDENSVYWPTNVSYTHDTVSYGINDNGYFYSSFKFAAEEHGGTHFDAPIHFGENKNTIEKVPLSQLYGHGVVVDVSESASQNADYLVGVEDFADWEARNGRMPDGAIVLLRTGHGRFYHDRDKYLGTSLTGAEAIPHLHFPGLGADAAKWLAEERNIKAVGLDTPSIDYGQSKEFMAHRILCDNDLTIYENVANLDQLPESGAFIIALPMKIKGGSGAPLRIVALLPQEPDN